MTDYCSIDGCSKPRYARGYCNLHWQRWKRRGTPGDKFRMRALVGTPELWIYENINYIGVECLIWPFARRANGWPKMANHSPARLMCGLVNGPPPSAKHQVAHSCGNGDKGCLSPQHLRWATATENAADKRKHGTLLYGEKIANAKLTEKLVREIRLYKDAIPARVFANRLGISQATISRVMRNETWKHVKL